jgi:hypothetical protein
VAQAVAPKVVVIVLENEQYTNIVGSASAPYLNSLITQVKLFTDYHAISSTSALDYRAMTSGLTDLLVPRRTTCSNPLTSRAWGGSPFRSP